MEYDLKLALEYEKGNEKEKEKWLYINKHYKDIRILNVQRKKSWWVSRLRQLIRIIDKL